MSNVSLASDRVPVAPLREAFLASGLTLSQVCYRLGWTRQWTNGQQSCTIADSSRLRRALGMSPWPRGKRPEHWQRRPATRIGYEHATRIARAIGVAPYEVGL